jgi:6-phosphogluconolactonase/glucosamine-6-phosphate isomerase/deaminase
LIFLVTGEDKAEAVARAFTGPPDPRAPASLVEPASGSVELICDEAAANRL